jgi:hypothetical protein
MIAYALILVGLALLGLAVRFALDHKRAWEARALLFVVLTPPGVGIAAFGVLNAWVSAVVPPEPVHYTVANGIRYERKVMDTPFPRVWHVVKVDLRTPGLQVLVTPGDPSRLLPVNAKTPSDFAREVQADMVINGDVFEPKHSFDPFAPPPTPGDALRPLGFAASKGVPYGKAPTAGVTSPTLFFAENNVANIGTPSGTAYNAISGDCIFLTGGKLSSEAGCALPGKVIARSGAGLDRDRQTLILVVVDGQQATRSLGATLEDFAKLMADEGADTAIELDSGSSSALAGRRAQGGVGLLSGPVTGGVPGLEKPVANHLAIIGEQRLTTAY